MNVLTEYIRTIAYYMIFAALIEIIAPAGSFKKYIRLVLSLILTALLIQPLAALLQGEPTFSEGSFLKFQNMFDNNLLSAEREGYEKAANEAVVNEYQKSLNEQAQRIIETRTGLAVTGTEVLVNGDYESEEFAQILGIHASVQLPEGSGDINKTKKALFGNADGQVNGEALKKDTEQNIKNYLADFYNIPDDNIHITVQDG